MKNNFSLRDVSDDDHPWLVNLHNDPAVLRNVTNPLPITLSDHMMWWGTIDGKKEIRKIFFLENEKIGFCKFYKIDKINKNCILGADIHKQHRGKGYSKSMWQMMMNFCYKEMNLERISLTTADFNKIAQKVYLDLGFVEEGKMFKSLIREGTFYDQICMYHLREWKVNEV
jgi:RimJ/RimL family protein N-acetyltransferase